MYCTNTYRLSFSIIFLCLIFQTYAQIGLPDYARADSFRWLHLRKQLYHLQVQPRWLEDGSGFWYQTNTREGKRFYRVETQNPSIKALFDHDKLAQMLKDSLDQDFTGTDLPIERIRFNQADQVCFQINLGTWMGDPNYTSIKSFCLDLTTEDFVIEKTDKKRSQGQNADRGKAPNNKWLAYIESYNLWVANLETDQSYPLSSDGQKGYEYATYYGWGDIMKGEGMDRPYRFLVNWSPDSRYIQSQVCDLRTAQKMYLLDWSKADQYRPQLLSYFRGSPGDSQLVYYQPVLFDIEKMTEVSLELPHMPHFMGMDIQWHPDSKYMIGIYSERGFKKRHIVRINPETGQIKPLYSEESETNIEWSNFTYKFDWAEDLLFFTSEKSGWNQIYGLDLNSGKCEAITRGEFVVEEIQYLDVLQHQVYFTANGKEEDRNPYHSHLYRVDFDASDLVLLTPENLHHNIYFAPKGGFFVDNMSHAQQPTESVLRKASDGSILLRISTADIEELLKTGWQYPEVFKVKGRDGKTDIYGVLYKPSQFDPTQQYPIIDQSYTGPHTNLFPSQFSRMLRSPRLDLVELGFVLLIVDGMGSAGRSKEFHNWSYGQLGENLIDHVGAIRQLAEQYSWLDTSRVGIFGHSAGGYDAAHALLRFPDFYTVGVASSADHDHRMEKAWWPEMYMGWPVDSAYHFQSNITMAGNLKGKLLITHGGIDENVNPSATFKLAEALVQADKDFDMLIFPSERHGYRGAAGPYFIKKRWNYFIEHLLQEKPIWDYQLKEP